MRGRQVKKEDERKEAGVNVEAEVPRDRDRWKGVVRQGRQNIEFTGAEIKTHILKAG